ncbi:hypothetical protein AB4124_30365 [Paenibacillus sp. 2KB_20]|uniref:hypothetical protein n=1 Tax=Paenibacillus sp. 2KB_20 TaxID=3232977 RepID=UPI003F9BFBFC
MLLEDAPCANRSYHRCCPHLPMDLEEDIPEDHLVRVVNEAINRLDDRIFVSAYKRKRRKVDMKYGSGSIEAKSAKVVRSKKHVR